MNSNRKNVWQFFTTVIAAALAVAIAIFSMVVLPGYLPELIRWFDKNIGPGWFWIVAAWYAGSGLLGVLLLIYLMCRYQRRRRMLAAGQARR